MGKLEPNNETSVAYLEKSRKKYVAMLQRQKMMNDGQSVQTKSTRSVSNSMDSSSKGRSQDPNKYNTSSSLRARLEALKNNKNSPDTVVSSRGRVFDENSSVSSRQSSRKSSRRNSGW